MRHELICVYKYRFATVCIIFKTFDKYKLEHVPPPLLHYKTEDKINPDLSKCASICFLFAIFLVWVPIWAKLLFCG